jgi:hypothetical protein
MAAAIMIERDSEAAAQHQGTPPDPVREFTANGADMRLLFPDIDRLVSRNEYPYSFLSNRFGSVEEYRNAMPLTAGLIPFIHGLILANKEKGLGTKVSG